MIHTIHIDDSTIKGKQLVKKLQKETAIVHFDNPAISGIIPEGYLTVEEFRTEAKAKVNQRFKEHGLL